jgi:hypothetical protein
LDQEKALLARRDELDVADLSRRILACQARLMKLSAGKTRRLEAQTQPKIPDVAKGVKPRQ